MRVDDVNAIYSSIPLPHLPPDQTTYASDNWPERYRLSHIEIRTVSEFNEFKPRLKSQKNRFQLSADLNLEKLNTILRGTNQI